MLSGEVTSLEKGERLDQRRQTSGNLVQVNPSILCPNSLYAHRGREWLVTMIIP